MKKLCLIALVLLSACEKPVWVKPGASTSDFGTDKYSCMQGSMAAAPAVAGTNAYGNSYSNSYGGGSSAFAAKTHDINAGNRNEMFKACMESKGWILEKASDISVPKKQWKDDLAVCKQNRDDGMYKTFSEYVACGNNANTRYALTSNSVSAKQVHDINALRTKLAVQVDKGKITEAEFYEKAKSKGAEIIANPPN